MARLTNKCFVKYASSQHDKHHDVQALPLATALPAKSRFLRTSLNPPRSRTNASINRMTPNVTMAPITPLTAGDSPLPLVDEPALLPEDDVDPLTDAAYGAQVPVVLPQT